MDLRMQLRLLLALSEWLRQVGHLESKGYWERQNARLLVHALQGRASADIHCAWNPDVHGWWFRLILGHRSWWLAPTNHPSMAAEAATRLVHAHLPSVWNPRPSAACDETMTLPRIRSPADA